jgi:epoxyqueuosine reductase QueG
MESSEAAALIRDTITHEVSTHNLITGYREAILGIVSADDPGFEALSSMVGFNHYLPSDLLPGARSVVCFFLPFSPDIVYANQAHKDLAAREWAIAYLETNMLIDQITSGLIEKLYNDGIRAAAEPATGNFDHTALKSHWSHKSIAVMSGIGSFGLHQLVITDAGCAGRFGSFVVDVELPITKPLQKERCEYYVTGTCLDCVLACPVQALAEDALFNRGECWQQCLRNGEYYQDLGDQVHICGKCAVLGPCALESAV